MLIKKNNYLITYINLKMSNENTKNQGQSFYANPNPIA